MAYNKLALPQAAQFATSFTGRISSVGPPQGTCLGLKDMERQMPSPQQRLKFRTFRSVVQRANT